MRWARSALTVTGIWTSRASINLSFAEWTTVFGDAKMTTALLDRHASLHILETGSDSYRFRNHGTDIRTDARTPTQPRPELTAQH